MRNRTALSIAASILAPFCLPLAGLAQSPPKPGPAFKTPARQVILPVTVRDKHGALVTNFTAADLTLTQDDRPQKIEGLTRQSTLPFRLGLLVDTSRGMSRAMDAERKAAEKFVDTMLPASPSAGQNQAFLIHFDSEVELLQDFTSSRDKLHSELVQMGPTSRDSQEDRQGPETAGDNRDWSRRDRSPQLYDAIFLASDELMKNKDGRKALIVFSDGVDHGSKESLNDAVDAADRAGLEIYTIYFKGEGERSTSGFPGRGGRRGGMGGGYPGGGGGYPGGGYPGGGYPRNGGNGGGRASNVDGKKILEKIAQRTGGRAFEAKKTDNLDDIYNQIAAELHGQYLLTFTPDQVDNEGGYHKIAIKANKGDYEVVTREGYYAPAGK